VSAWTAGPDLPQARGGAAAAWLGERFVVAGGNYWQDGVKRWTDRVDAYDPATRRWESLPPVPEAAADAGSASDDSSLYLAGGTSGGTATDRCRRLRFSAGTWRWEALPPLPRPLAYGGSVAAGGALYYLGGCSDPADLRTAGRDCYRLDLKRPTAGWKKVRSLPEPGRCLAAAAEQDGRPILLGGCFGNASGKPVNLADALRYDPKRDRWEKLASLPQPVRAATAVSLGKPGLALLGGYSAAADAMDRYGPAYGFERRAYLLARGRFREIAALPGAALGPAAAAHGGVLYLAGGEDRSRSRTAAFHSARAEDLLRNETGRPVWVCLGDSVTAGVGRSGVTEAQTYPRELERSLSGTPGAPWVVNGGLGGENTRQALQRLPSLLKPLVRVDRVIIMYGLNDAALIDGGPRDRVEPRVPVAEYAENLRALVAEVRRQGARPTLCTPNPMTRAYPYAGRGLYATNPDINFMLKEFVEASRRVAKDEKVPLVDVYELFRQRKDWEKLFPDGIHPNAEGLAMIALALRTPESLSRR
jgi:lysophospholipase L1-like esterase/N-acetylneuraminic acid mutarotase